MRSGATWKPCSRNAACQARTCMSLVSTSVPSRSNRTAASIAGLRCNRRAHPRHPAAGDAVARTGLAPVPPSSQGAHARIVAVSPGSADVPPRRSPHPPDGMRAAIPARYGFDRHQDWLCSCVDPRDPAPPPPGRLLDLALLTRGPRRGRLFFRRRERSLSPRCVNVAAMGNRWLFVLWLSAACVKQSTYDAALAENHRLQGELQASQNKQAETEKTLGDKIKELQAQLGTLDETTRTKEAELGKIKGEKEAREAELGKVKGEKAATEAELTELRRQKEAAEKRIAAYKTLQDKFRALVDTGKLQVVFRNGQMTLKLPSGILFPSGSADLSKGGQQALTEVTNVLLQFKDRRFLVAGHTDNQPIKTAAFPNNWFLSTARANSVVQHMIKGGFPSTNLAAAGYAEFDPVAPNDKEEGREQNRRIEIILVPNLEELPSLTGNQP